jgi:hypothetical protein
LPDFLLVPLIGSSSKATEGAVLVTARGQPIDIYEHALEMFAVP